MTDLGVKVLIVSELMKSSSARGIVRKCYAGNELDRQYMPVDARIKTKTKASIP